MLLRTLHPLLGPPKKESAVGFIVGPGGIPLALSGMLQAIRNGR